MTDQNKKDHLELVSELAKVVSPQKLAKATPITDIKPANKIRQFYDGLRANKWKTEDAAIATIYGEGDYKNAFAKLKFDLIEKLTQNVALINFGEGEAWEYKKAYWECRSKYHTALLLFKFTNATKVGEVMLAKIFPKCLKYEFTDLIIGIANTLGWKAKISSDFKTGDYYETFLNQYLEIQVVECRGRMFLGNMYGLYLTDKSVKPQVPQKSLEYLAILESRELVTETQQTIYYKRMMGVIYEMSQYNYVKTAALCEDAIAFLENQAFVDPIRIRAFYLQAIASYAYLREIDKGYALLIRAYNLVGEGGPNWFKVQELAVMLALYAEDYQKAYEIYLVAIENAYFKKQNAPTQEHWHLVEAHLHVLQTVGKITPKDGKVLEVRFQSFVNKIPKISHDKRGVGFSIHVLHLFHLLHKGTVKAQDTYMDRMESIRLYISRYCNDKEMQRSQWMCNLLLCVEELGFAKTKIDKSHDVQNYLHLLRTTPFDITDSNLDVEILPFDMMFGYLCSRLVK